MAEETPGNLGGEFGGFASGRAAGNRNLDASVDRLEEQINKFSDALQNLTSRLNATGSQGGGAGGSQSGGKPNGGGSTFNGAHAGTSAGPLSNIMGAFNQQPGAHTGGTHADGSATIGGGGPIPTGGGGGSHRGTPNGGAGGFLADHAGAIAKGAGAAGVTGLAVFTTNHYAPQVSAITLGSMYAGGGMGVSAAQRGLYDNYTAHGTNDRLQAAGLMGQQGGALLGGSLWAKQQQMVQSASAVNPTISNTQTATASMALGSVGTFNRMQGLGINPLGAGGMGDPRSVARQILARMGANKVKTAEQVAAAFGPAGSITVTLNNYVAQGFLPAAAAENVRSEMRNILMAQIHGMNYSEYNKTAITASKDNDTSAAARNRLTDAGISANSPVSRQYRSAGMSAQSEKETLGGFAKSVDLTTSAVDKFRGALNKILEIPGVGEAVGASSGVLGRVPVLGGLLSKISHGIMGIGGMAPTMSSARFGGGMAPASQVGGGYGGTAMARQSGRASGHGGGSGGVGSSGLHLSPPRPGLNSMSSEQDFGARNIGQGWHTGIDLSGGVGAPVRAAAAGTVVAAGWGASGDAGYGNVILIDHGGGWKTMYAHLSHIGKGKGRKVNKGEVIGAVGDTGSYSQGAHLHFEVWRNGKPVDPEPFLRGQSMSGASGSAGGNGGASGSAVAGGTGTSLGQTQGYANAMGSSGGGGGTTGYFSENAALGLSGGGGGGGMLGSSSGGATSDGGASGVVSSSGGIGGSGDVSIGAYNFKHGKVPMSDVDKIMARVGIFGTSETRSNSGRLSAYLRQHGWGYKQGSRSDTGIAYNQGDYKMLKSGSRGIEGTLWGGKKMNNSVPYMLLQDKNTGAKFWVMSAHTQVHGYKGGAQGAVMRKQYAQINALYSELSKSGAPVFLVGDLNNPNAMSGGIAPHGASAHGSGLDYLISSGASYAGGGSLAGTGFHGAHNPNAVMSSDHPFVFGNFNLPGGGGGHGGTPAQNMALGRAMAAKQGWGSQWNALKTLWMHESGWNAGAQNPSSSAYGIAQFLDSTWGGYGHKTSDPQGQIAAGLKYIKSRYGSPTKAWDFWQKNHWYDIGEWNIRNDSDARVHKGEMILPSKIADVVRDELTSPGIRNILGGKRGGSGAQIVFHEGAIQVNLPGGTSKRQAQQAGRWVVDAMMEDRRMTALAEG